MSAAQDLLALGIEPVLGPPRKSWDWRHQGPPILRYLPDPDTPAKASGVLL